MSDIKRECPGCDSWTSAVGVAFQEGAPCPYCGLPADAAHAIDAARDRHVNEDMIKRYADAEARAVKAEEEAARLRGALDRIRRTLDEKLDG